MCTICFKYEFYFLISCVAEMLIVALFCEKQLTCWNQSLFQISLFKFKLYNKNCRIIGISNFFSYQQQNKLHQIISRRLKLISLWVVNNMAHHFSTNKVFTLGYADSN